MKRIFEKILDGVTVKFTEFAEFPHLSNNGGSYHLFTKVKALANGMFEISEWSSCDFVNDYETKTVTKQELRQLLHNIESHEFGWDAEAV
ncbi:MAG: hypothetical protein IJA18_07485 [Ruminococcus sp.]|nr:hypothetical protein [Ruminococcus sp.]